MRYRGYRGTRYGEGPGDEVGENFCCACFDKRHCLRSDGCTDKVLNKVKGQSRSQPKVKCTISLPLSNTSRCCIVVIRNASAGFRAYLNFSSKMKVLKYLGLQEFAKRHCMQDTKLMAEVPAA